MSALRVVRERTEKMVGFEQDYSKYDKLLRQSGATGLDRGSIYPCLDDRTSDTPFDRHYIYHPAWAARQLAKFRPQSHVDISSALYFSALVSAFVPVQFFDYRPAGLVLDNLTTGTADLTALPFADDSLESVSCMHVIEHIGLGRYGDPLDPSGDRKACAELARVLAKGGRLLIALPVGVARTAFNAHRVYSHHEVLEMFNSLFLVDCALIPDGLAPNGMIQFPDANTIDAQAYGCGCYLLTKP